MAVYVFSSRPSFNLLLTNILGNPALGDQQIIARFRKIIQNLEKPKHDLLLYVLHILNALAFRTELEQNAAISCKWQSILIFIDLQA